MTLVYDPNSGAYSILDIENKKYLTEHQRNGIMQWKENPEKLDMTANWIFLSHMETWIEDINLQILTKVTPEVLKNITTAHPEYFL